MIPLQRGLLPPAQVVIKLPYLAEQILLIQVPVTTNFISGGITNRSALQNTLTTGNNNDTISASNGINNINTGSGNDQITLTGGTNTLVTGNNNDTINVSGGNNDIDTDALGNDQVVLTGGTNT